MQVETRDRCQVLGYYLLYIRRGFIFPSISTLEVLSLVNACGQGDHRATSRPPAHLVARFSVLHIRNRIHLISRTGDCQRERPRCCRFRNLEVPLRLRDVCPRRDPAERIWTDKVQRIHSKIVRLLAQRRVEQPVVTHGDSAIATSRRLIKSLIWCSPNICSRGRKWNPGFATVKRASRGRHDGLVVGGRHVDYTGLI
jgi:hypothetical protein